MESDVLRELYEKYHQKAYLYVLSLCRDKETAEDIVSEGFEKAFLTVEGCPEGFFWWLLRGNGFPVGAFLACGKASTAMVPGDHGTTYGGNPFAGAAADAVLDIFEKEDILGKVNDIAPYLEETLDRIAAGADHQGHPPTGEGGE